MQALSDAVGALARRRFRLPAAGADRERARAALRRPLERALADLAGAAEVGEGAVGEVCHVLEGLACLIRTEFGAGDELQRALAAACVRVCSLCLDVVEQRCLGEPAGGGGVCARLLGVVRCLSGDAGDVDLDRVALRVQEDAEDFEGPESVRAGGPGADPGAGAAVRLAGDLPAADVGLGFGVQFEEVAVQAFSALSVTPRLLRLVTRLVRGLEADGGASRAGVETLELAVRCYRNVVGLLCKWDVGDKHLYEIKDLNALTESVCRLFPVAPAPEGAPAAGRAPIEGLYGELLETLRGHPSRKVQQAAAQFAKLRASQLWEQYLGACPSPREFVRADGCIDAELAARGGIRLRGAPPPGKGSAAQLGRRESPSSPAPCAAVRAAVLAGQARPRCASQCLVLGVGAAADHWSPSGGIRGVCPPRPRVDRGQLPDVPGGGHQAGGVVRDAADALHGDQDGHGGTW